MPIYQLSILLLPGKEGMSGLLICLTLFPLPETFDFFPGMGTGGGLSWYGKAKAASTLVEKNRYPKWSKTSRKFDEEEDNLLDNVGLTVGGWAGRLLCPVPLSWGDDSCWHLCQTRWRYGLQCQWLQYYEVHAEDLLPDIVFRNKSAIDS